MLNLSEISSTDVGVDDLDNNNDEEITIFPVPARETLTLSSKHKVQSLKIINTLGKEVLHQANNDVQLSIDVSMLLSGLYFIEVTVCPVAGVASQSTAQAKIIRKKFVKE